jgi:hypothetical protein
MLRSGVSLKPFGYVHLVCHPASDRAPWLFHARLTESSPDRPTVESPELNAAGQSPLLPLIGYVWASRPCSLRDMSEYRSL